jgi:hypothetical protein
MATTKPRDPADGPTTDKAVNKQILNPTSGTTMADTGALNGVVPTGQRTAEQEATDEARRRVTDPDAEVFVSEGMRHDLASFGLANDPVTGRRVKMDKSGKITAEPRE